MLTHIDPVCGMIVRGDRFTAAMGDRTAYFCSAYCRRLFQENPEKYPSRPAKDDRGRGPSDREVAYFSMEVAVRPEMHTYSGGLGVLAGEHSPNGAAVCHQRVSALTPAADAPKAPRRERKA